MIKMQRLMSSLTLVKIMLNRLYITIKPINMSLLVLKIGYNDFPVSFNKVTIALNHKTTKLFLQLLLCFHIVNCYIDSYCYVRARSSQVRNMKIILPVNRKFSPILFNKTILKTVCTTYRTVMKKNI